MPFVENAFLALNVILTFSGTTLENSTLSRSIKYQEVAFRTGIDPTVSRLLSKPFRLQEKHRAPLAFRQANQLWTEASDLAALWLGARKARAPSIMYSR